MENAFVVEYYSTNPNFCAVDPVNSTLQPIDADGSIATDPQVISQAAILDADRVDEGDYSWLEDVAELANSI